MSWFDWVPTVGEVVDWTECRIIGHDWENGKCKTCGKKKS